MSFSYSKVSTWNDCPYKYKLRYVDKLEVKPDLSPSNALYFGTATHEGIEHRSVESALESYKSNYPEITEAHEVEMLKLKTILPKAFEQIPEGEYEKCLRDKDGFIGFIDCIVENEDGTVDLLDFKTSNNVSGYLKSQQLHVYKYYYEKLTGRTVKNLYYVFIPKFKDTLTEGMSEEDIETLKKRIVDYFKDKNIRFERVEYDDTKKGLFFARKAMMEKDTEFPKRYTTMCQWCDYKLYCRTNGQDKSELVEKEPVLKEVNLFE